MARAKGEGAVITSKSISAKISSQNQITIPIEVRQSFDCGPGDKLVFVFDENQEQILIKAQKKESLLDLFGSMPPKGSTEQMDWEEIRKLAREEMISPE